MNYVFPDYYSQFECIGSECEDTCCAGWQIVIDNKSMKKYMDYKGGFGNRLCNSIDFKEQTFKQYNRRCAFLNEENLCDIYSEAGKDMLCRTCKNYPRHIEEFEGYREVSLSLSCPIAAKIMLTNTNKVTFIEKEKSSRDESYDDFDYLLFDKLLEVREAIISILQNREINIYTRMAMVLALSHDVQTRIDKNSIFEIDDVICRYAREDAYIRFESEVNSKKQSCTDRKDIMKDVFSIFRKLEKLKPNWEKQIGKYEDILYRRNSYEKLLKYRLDDNTFEQLMVYFVFTYYLGAVYDCNQYSKMKLAIISTMLINEIAMATYYENANISIEDIIRISYRYAKEVEHSDINLDILEKEFINNKIYSIENIIYKILM